MSPKITDVFFDLDHTLWDFEANSALAFLKVFFRHKINVDLEKFIDTYVPINIKYWELYRKDLVTQAELRHRRLKDTFDILEYKTDDSQINFISEKYIEYLPEFNHLHEGTIEILEYLKPKYNLHIITNGFDQIQYSKMKNSNIEQYFQTVTNSEMAGVKKPNPKIFEHALSLAKANKATSIMIGDCIEADVQGALNAGMDAILYNENKKAVPVSVKQINHLLELKIHL